MCTGRNADTPSSSQMLMFTLVISIKSPICPASFQLYLSSKSLHMTGIKITFIYSTLTCLRAACMNVERVDVIKATPIRSNKNLSPVNPSFVKFTTSRFQRCLFPRFNVLIRQCSSYSKNKPMNRGLFSVSDSL